jgi:hypothetical protein
MVVGGRLGHLGAERVGVGSGSPGTRGGHAVICEDVIAGELKLGIGRAGEDVWEVLWSEVSSNACSGMVFIGRSSGHQG